MSSTERSRSGGRRDGEPRPREHPVPRLRALAAIAALLVLVLAALAAIDQLRPTVATPTPAVDIAASDPRDALECPGLEPREGLERDDPAAFERLPVATVSSGDLLDCPEFFDGRRVVYRGEVVGQVLGRGARAWIQVNDDAYAGDAGPLPAHRFYLGGNSGMGVHAPVEELAAIRWRGGPTAHGDQVEIHGIFHRTEPRTGEVAVIAAREVRVIAEGRPLPRLPRRDRRVVAYVLVVVAAALVVVERRRARA